MYDLYFVMVYVVVDVWVVVGVVVFWNVLLWMYYYGLVVVFEVDVGDYLVLVV